MKASKRLLALVLCLAMVLSLGTVAFAAESAGIDQGELAAAPAQVQWLVDNGYVIGYDDGSLGLATNITRAQFATILARADGLADADAATYAPMAPNYFSDVSADSWYAGYVAYCYGKGIVAGYGDGTFKPEQDVTGIEAAKMILCSVLDYDQAPYTGSALWSFNVMTDAEAAGLTADVDANLSEAIDRENAFIMLYNALYAPSFENHGLAYIKDYDVAALYCSGGSGAEDDPYQYTIAEGFYTADSFTPWNDGADIELYQYTVDTTTGKGVLTLVDGTVYMDADRGEAYFFAKVTDPDGVVTWYKFIPAGAYEFKDLTGIIIANEYADLYDDEPRDEGITILRVGDVNIPLFASTDLDALGMVYKVSTTTNEKGVYHIVADSLIDLEAGYVIATDAKAYKTATGKLASDYEAFYNFSEKPLDDEIVSVELDIKFTTEANVYLIGDKVPVDILEDYFNYGDNNKTGLNYKRWYNAHVVEEFPEFTSEELNDYVEGFVYKYIDTDGDRAGKYDIVLVLAYKGAAGVENRPGTEPTDDDYLAFAAEPAAFAGLTLGADGPTREVALYVTIDGTTYVNIADSEIITPKKADWLESDIPTVEMRGYLVGDNVDADGDKIDVMEAGDTYVVYYDLLGNSFAAKLAGSDYVLVTELSRASSRSSLFGATLMFPGEDEADFDVYMPTTDVIANLYEANDKDWNRVSNLLDAEASRLDDVNSVNYFNNFRRIGEGQYWTTLASYLPAEEGDAFDYTLLTPYYSKNAGVDYVPIPIPASLGNPRNIVIGYQEDPRTGDETEVYAQITNATDIYLVYGDERVGGYLLDVEYYQGSSKLPVIMDYDIHGIYGIVEEDRGNVVASTLVIEVFRTRDYAVDFAYQTGAKTFGDIGDDDLARISAAYSGGEYEDPAFYIIEDGELDTYLSAREAFVGYVRWLPFEVGGMGMGPEDNTMYAVGADICDDVAFVLGYLNSARLTSAYNLAAGTVPLYTNQAKVYAIKENDDGYFFKEELSGMDVQEGDYVVGIFGGNSVTVTGPGTLSSDLYADIDGITYYIDLSQSAKAVYNYFGFDSQYVKGAMVSVETGNLIVEVADIEIAPTGARGAGSAEAQAALLDEGAPDNFSIYKENGKPVFVDMRNAATYGLADKFEPPMGELAMYAAVLLIDPDGAFTITANAGGIAATLTSGDTNDNEEEVDIFAAKYYFDGEDLEDAEFTLKAESGETLVFADDASYKVYCGERLVPDYLIDGNGFLAEGGTLTLFLEKFAANNFALDDITIEITGVGIQVGEEA